MLMLELRFKGDDSRILPLRHRTSSVGYHCGVSSLGLHVSPFWRIVLLTIMSVMMLVPTEQYTAFNGGALIRTLQTLEAVSCEGSTLVIACPTATLISILDARFGRSVPTSQMCGASYPNLSRVEYMEDKEPYYQARPTVSRAVGENTNCLAIHSLEVVLDLCQDRARCTVLAQSTTFWQDPCPATSKYLEVHYKCRPSEFETVTECEGNEMQISCRKSNRIAIYSAMFGRTHNGSSSCPPNRLGYINCQSAETVAEVRTACQGRKRCDLLVSEAVFGNPCSAGINKYLTVTYACVPKKILKELRRHRGRLGPKRSKKKKGKEQHFRQGEESRLTPDSADPSGPWTASQPTGLLQNYLQAHDLETAHAGEATVRRHPHHSPGKAEIHTPWPTGLTAASSNSRLDSSVITTQDHLDPNNFYPKVDNSDSFHSNGYKDLVTPGQSRLIESRGNWSELSENSFNRPHVGQSEASENSVNSARPEASENSVNSARPEDSVNSVNSARPEGSENSVNSARPEASENSVNSARPEASENSVNSARPEASENIVKGASDQPVTNRVMSTELTDSDETTLGSVTDANLTVLGVNQTADVPTVRTLPSNNQVPVGVVKELFSTLRLVQGHQEKAILYMVLGITVGLVLLLIAILGRTCYKLKHNTHAKLDITDPTHSRNVSHLVHHMNHHSLLETPMLEHSDSIDRIEVVRFEPRGTLRSGYHSTLRSDSGDRSLNNYYG